MAKGSGSTRSKGPSKVDYSKKSMSADDVRENWDKIDKFVNSNTDKFREAMNNGTLPDWVMRDKNIRDVLDTIVKAREVGDIIQNEAEQVAARHGGTVTPINYKGFASTHRKVTNPNNPTPIWDLGDSVRNTIVVGRGGIDGVVADLERLPSFDRHKTQSTDYGYTGHLLNFRMPNGIRAEIQVNTPKMIYAKESPEVAKRILGTKVWNQIRKETGLEGGLGHRYYEKGRKLDDGPELDEIKRQSREYYSHFS